MGNLLFVLISILFVFVTSAQAEPCRSIEYARIDRVEQVDGLKDVCEITQSLAVFVDDAVEITFPNLKSVGLINIDSKTVEAVAFPKLETAVDIYLSGSTLKVAEFPSLKTVHSRLVVQEKELQFLNFPSLTQVGRLILSHCLKLEFVFAEQVFDIASIRIENNPVLNPVSAANLRKVTRKMGNKEYELFQNSQNRMREFRSALMQGGATPAPPRPTTGHKTYFDYYGFIKSYYEWYPYEYSRYWGAILPWGYTLFYSY